MCAGSTIPKPTNVLIGLVVVILVIQTISKLLRIAPVVVQAQEVPLALQVVLLIAVQLLHWEEKHIGVQIVD